MKPGRLDTPSGDQTQNLVHRQSQHAEHQMHHHLCVAAYKDSVGTKFIFRPRVGTVSLPANSGANRLGVFE